jgi:ketosteroid isomerase-like protein
VIGSPEGNLERRIAQLEARHELSDLVAGYAAAVDAKDIDAFVALFTDDARYGELVGKEGIRSLVGPWMAKVGASFHYPHTQVVRFLSPDKAVGTVTSHAEIAMGVSLVLSAIRYEDEYSLEGGSWKFAVRCYKYFYRLRLEDLAAHYGEVMQS